MGFMDDLKKLTKPYTEDDDDFDEFDDDARPSRPSRSSSAPKPSYRSSFDLDSDEFSSTGSSAASRRRSSVLNARMMCAGRCWSGSWRRPMGSSA